MHQNHNWRIMKYPMTLSIIKDNFSVVTNCQIVVEKYSDRAVMNGELYRTFSAPLKEKDRKHAFPCERLKHYVILSTSNIGSTYSVFLLSEEK